MPGLLVSVLFGFIAQTIDGALGMAYGVSCTTFLLTFGITPAVATTSVKVSEIFTTAVSGLSHLRFGNVDRKLFLKLCVPGVTGGIIGAFILSQVPGERIKPFVSAYLLIMGGIILARAFRKTAAFAQLQDRAVPLGFIGGLLDGIGGGGWGPVVTTNLIARGREPHLAIGSVNLAEFFVTAAQAITLTSLVGLQHKEVVLGLIIGGVVAAPLAAYLCKKIPTKTLLVLVGSLIILLSLRNLFAALR